MDNLFLIKSEILIMLISFWYFIYFTGDKIYSYYFSVKIILKPQNINKTLKLKKINLENKEKNYKKKLNKWINLSEQQKIDLTNIIKRVDTNIVKWYYDKARNLIVEWLAIDKYNKDLNIELAIIYEKEKKYKNAEYIYNEVIENIKDATSVIKKLWFVLALQQKYKKSIKAYEKVHKRNKSDVEVIDMLANLNYKIWKYNMSLKYIILSLKDTPRSTEKLILAWNSYEKLREYSHAIDYYNKVLEIQPYNTEIIEKIKLLEK